MVFPGARGHFNYANLFFAKCFSLANSQTFNSRINNQLYGMWMYGCIYVDANGGKVDD